MATKVQFKFRENTSNNDREQLIAQLGDGGADSIEPVFPDAPDKELAAFYRALISDERQYTKLLRMLKRSTKVEFAEPEATRRLILPIERNPHNGSRR
jgi:hypothetical protein